MKKPFGKWIAFSSSILLLLVFGGIYWSLGGERPLGSDVPQTSPPTLSDSEYETGHAVPEPVRSAPRQERRRLRIGEAAPPGLRGEALLSEPGDKTQPLRLVVKDLRGKVLAEKKLLAPGRFVIGDWQGDDAVILDGYAEGYAPSRVYTRRGRRNVVLQFTRDGGRGGLQWTIGPSPSEPSPDLSTVQLFGITDPDTERMGTSRQDFFEGLMNSMGKPLAPIIEKRVKGEIDASGHFRFRLSSVPAGSFVFYVATQMGRSHAEKIKILPRQDKKLGLLHLREGTLLVAVYDKTTRQPLAGVSLMPLLGKGVIGEEVRSDSYGMARLRGFLGDRIRANAAGYYAADFSAKDIRVSSTTKKIEVALPPECYHVLWMNPVDTLDLELPPGSWVAGSAMMESGRHHRYGDTVGPSGKLKVPAGEYGRISCYDPVSQDFWMRPIRRKKLVKGRASIVIHAGGSKQKLEWGSIILRHKSEHYKFVAGLRHGVARITGLPVGRYSIGLRVGSLIHDNNHEFWLNDRHLGENNQLLKLRLPESSLRIRVLGRDRRPLSHRKVFLRMRTSPSKSYRMVRVSIEARTGIDGNLQFDWLPEGLCQLRIGKTRFQVQTSDKLQTLVLP